MIDPIEILQKARMATASKEPFFKAAYPEYRFELAWMIVWHAQKYLEGRDFRLDTDGKSAAFEAQFPNLKQTKKRP